VSDIGIRNFALIDQLSVQLGPGLNVLTGETGAGKSIVVGALSLLLGERASTDVVRVGEDRATVEGVFELNGDADLITWLEGRGIAVDEGLVILKREVALEGRSRAWINGSPTTASLLGDVGGRLVNLHGQHEHQTLLRRDEQRAILDAFAGTEQLVGEVSASHGVLMRLSEELRTLEQRRREIALRADYLRFQIDEIEGANVEIGEVTTTGYFN
jgi:DNA repair protein RecN (Recombination protein N)